MCGFIHSYLLWKSSYLSIYWNKQCDALFVWCCDDFCYSKYYIIAKNLAIVLAIISFADVVAKIYFFIVTYNLEDWKNMKPKRFLLNVQYLNATEDAWNACFYFIFSITWCPSIVTYFISYNIVHHTDEFKTRVTFTCLVYLCEEIIIPCLFFKLVIIKKRGR